MASLLCVVASGGLLFLCTGCCPTACGVLIPGPGIEPMCPTLQSGFFLSFFNEGWLWYCAGFCHTSTWISHRCTRVPSLSSLPPTSHPPTPSRPSRLSQSRGLSSLSHTANPHWLSIFQMLVCMFPYYSVSICPTLSFLPPPPLCPEVCSLCCISIPALQIGSLVARWIPDHWATREGPLSSKFFLSSLYTCTHVHCTHIHV